MTIESYLITYQHHSALLGLGNKTNLTSGLGTGLSHFALTGQFAFISSAPTVLNDTAQTSSAPTVLNDTAQTSSAPTVLNDIAQCEALGKPSNSPSPERHTRQLKWLFFLF
ncbi:MAG: hypothetical protein QM496_16265 [Verrucomicrobiota bacterium]